MYLFEIKGVFNGIQTESAFADAEKKVYVLIPTKIMSMA
jgi:hypothetical protein